MPSSIVYPVVTVTMDRREIDGLVVMTVSIKMMQVDTCIGHEEKPTYLAAAFLLFAHRGQPKRNTRRGSATACPVTPVAIVGTRDPTDLHMPHDCDAAMLVEGEPVTIAENPPLSGRNIPISSTNPVARFSGVSVSGPSRQFDVALMIEFLEDLFANYSPVIITPACNFWIQQSNEVSLLGRFVAADALR
jgi:hypothetical protein